MDLNFKILGQGPALLILHGLFGSLDNWITIARILSDTYTVILVDQRNHGKSPYDPVWDYQTMSEDLNEFMDDQGIMQAHLIGHSMGGKTVMNFAAHYPERIDKLVVVDMAPKAYEPQHQTIIKALNDIELQHANSRNEIGLQLAQDIEDSGTVQFLMKGLKRNDTGGFDWKFNLSVISENYTNILEEVQMEEVFEGETLFLNGGQSGYVRPEDRADIRNKFPAAKFRTIEKAGHWVHAQAPEAFIQEIQEFLAS